MGSDASIRTALICAALVFVTCMAFVYATPQRGTWVVDNGARVLLAKRLLDAGRVDLEYPAADLDPTGAAFPIRPPYAVRIGERYFSQYPVAYPALAVPFLAILGPPGLRLPAALGTALAAALVALWITPIGGAAWGLAAGLATGLATPLFFHGVTVWDHSLTTALALAACYVATQPSTLRLLLAGALMGLACWFRAELALMGLALAIVLFLERRRFSEVAALAAGALPMAVMLLLFHLSVYGELLGPHVGGNVGVTAATAEAGAGVLLRRVGSLLAAQAGSEARFFGMLAALLIAWVGGAVATRRGYDLLAVFVAVGIGAAATLQGALHVANASVPFFALPYYNGLLVQVPWFALAGVGIVRLWRDEALQTLRFPVSVGLVFLLIAIPSRVLLTDFFTGGNWGPRMLTPAIPSLLLLAWAALRVDARRPQAALAAALLLLAALGSTGVSGWLLNRQKLEVEQLEIALLEAPQPVIVTDHRALGQQLPGLWGQKALLLVDASTFSRTLGVARARGLDRFLLLRRPMRGSSAERVPGADCKRLASYQGTHSPVVFDLERLDCRMRRPLRARPLPARPKRVE